MEKRYDSDGSERQWQRLHRKKKKTKISIELYEIVMKSFIQTYFFLCLLMAEFMRVTLGGYKGDSSTLTLKSNSVENN